MRKLLFSITAKDCRWDYYRGSGKGGQKRNKTDNCCRCTHVASGAVGKAEDGRSQRHNRELAFKRMAETKEFKKWHKIESSRHLGLLVSIEDSVNREMKKVRIESKSEEGLWVEGLTEKIKDEE